MTISFRPETSEDDAFLRRLILGPIIEELGAETWTEPMRTHLAGVQYTSRRQGVRGRYPDGESRIVVADGIAAGWLYTAGFPEVVWLVEVMILSEFRGHGIGSAAVRKVVESAGARPVQLKVNVTNDGATRLYERLGFRRIGGDEVQHLMEHPVRQPC